MKNNAKNRELQCVLRALLFRSSISGLLRSAATESELTQKACEIAIDTADYRMAWVGLIENDPEKTVRPVSRAGLESGYLDTIKLSWADCELGRGPTGTSIRERRPVVCRDFSVDPKMNPWREEALKRGYLSSISLPLIVEDKVIGVYTLYSEKPDLFPEEEVSLLLEVASDIAYAISNLREKKQRIMAEKALKAAKEEAEIANRLKSQFLDIAAHELRTPITAFSLLVQNGIKVIKSGASIDLATCERISTQIDRLSSLVDDLLNTSLLERGIMVMRFSPTDLSALISESLIHIKVEAPNRKLIFTHPNQPVKASVDPIRIQQVITNLIDNALKYSPENKPVEIVLGDTPSTITVSVTDLGLGIPKDQQAALFSRFFRIQSNETIRHPGLGLGLFICRSIVELHGGKIGFKSEANEGSTFYFELPKGQKLK